jgi:hypothetical protein
MLCKPTGNISPNQSLIQTVRGVGKEVKKEEYWQDISHNFSFA